ncbi:hypothetical protein G6F36_015694 [Rhizopus arrhizus]|nr:hypothetical protein G6F36_015694 [Rhizopus arrhizus]
MIEKETSPTVETNQEVSTSRNSLIDLDQILIEGSPAAQEPIVRKDAPLVSDVASSIHETNPADPPSQQPPVTAEQEDKGPPAPEEEVKSPEPERQDRFKLER